MRNLISLFICFFLSCSILPLRREDIKEFTSQPLEKQLKKFSSDGCSSWPEGTSTNPGLWIHCCFYHDLAYWIGGSKKARKKADKTFKSCIQNEHKQAAELMYFGVRQFGSPKLNSDYRWGYGWNYKRGYIKLNEVEKNFAKKFLPKKNEKISRYIDLKKTDVSEVNLHIAEEFNLHSYDR